MEILIETSRVTLNLPNNLLEQARRLAQSEQQSLDEFIAECLDEVLTPFPLDEGHLQIQMEVVAYERLHPHLISNYLNQFVAIMNGQVVDSDPDEVVLLKRIRHNYPEQVVLLRRVKSDLPDTKWIRSPRFLKE